MCRDEMMDEELAGMVNFTDETVPAEMPVMERERTIPQSPAATAPFTQGSLGDQRLRQRPEKK